MSEKEKKQDKEHKKELEEIREKERRLDEKKNEKNMLRARREHVTEMVLEPIADFTSEPFVSDRQVAPDMSLEQIIARALELEEKAHRFYNQASEKSKGLAEISRVLAKTGKKRAAHRARLEELYKPG